MLDELISRKTLEDPAGTTAFWRAEEYLTVGALGRLRVRNVETREVILAGGKPHQVPYVSPVRIELLGRHSGCGALVLGKEVLLRAIPMEDMNLSVEPARLKVSVNPRAPNIPMSVAMGNRAK